MNIKDTSSYQKKILASNYFNKCLWAVIKFVKNVKGSLKKWPIVDLGVHVLCYHWNRREVLIGIGALNEKDYSIGVLTKKTGAYQRGDDNRNKDGKSNYGWSSISCSLSDTYSLYHTIVFFVSKTYFQLLHLHPLLNLPKPTHYWN